MELYHLLLPVIDTSGLMRLFSNKGLEKMVESRDALGTQAKRKGLIKIGREREKGVGRILEGSRKTNPVGITIVVTLALVIDPNCIFHKVLESYGFLEA